MSFLTHPRLPLAIVGLGAVLLVVTIAGDVLTHSRFADPMPRSGEAFDLELVRRTSNLSALEAEANRELVALNSPDDQEVMAVLFDLSKRRFAHGQAKHNLFTNWLLWGLGEFRPEPFSIKNPDLLLKKSATALCGQVSQVLADLARRRNIDARVVQLDGHVVMEAFYDDAWHMYDASLEVPVRQNLYGDVPSVAQLIKEPEALHRLYDQGRVDVPALFLSTHNNHFADLDPVKMQRESLLQVLKYAIPLGLLAIGLWLSRGLRKSS